MDRSGGALQVLGTPLKNATGADVGRVIFTSFNDDSVGQNPDQLINTPNKGDWGGLVFTEDSDREDRGIFLSSINHADIRFGGGQVVVNSLQQIYNPIHMIAARPAVWQNIITGSADAGISADPNSFEDSEFQNSNFTADYGRVGPDVHGNLLTNNTLNGMFVRIRTESGQSLDPLTVAARFDDTDIVHVIAENLVIQGTLGGAEQIPVDVNDPTGPTFIHARTDVRVSDRPGHRRQARRLSHRSQPVRTTHRRRNERKPDHFHVCLGRQVWSRRNL